MTAKVHYADLWGVREVFDEDEDGERTLAGGKYQWLWQHEMSTTEWKELAPQSPSYLFVPQDVDLLGEYEIGWKLTDAFPISNNGITTARDRLVIDFDSKSISSKVETFLNPELSDDKVREKLELSENSEWRVAEARQELQQVRNWKELVEDFLYRPFDLRKIIYHRSVVWRPRYSAMRHMLDGQNVGLITTRQTKDKWDVLATTNLCGHKSCAAYDINSLFPLYLYPENTKANLFDEDSSDAPGGRRPNLAPEFVAEFAARLKMSFVADGRGDRVSTFGPEDIFSYMYAVFHSPTYRSRYGEFLKIDFPRLPLTSDAELFRALCTRGARLVALHLLEEDAPTVATFPVAGTNTVEQVRYTAPGEGGTEEGRVWLNREQYFAGVAPDVWDFHVGGYQVASKWLKDRKGRTLTFDDLAHYRRTVAALAETIRLMSDIDAVIGVRGGFPLA